MKNKTLLSASLVLMMAMPAATASAQGTLEDYNRAYALRHQFSADSVFHWARSSAWCDSTTYCIIRFLLLRAGSLYPMMPTRMR